MKEKAIDIIKERLDDIEQDKKQKTQLYTRAEQVSWAEKMLARLSDLTVEYGHNAILDDLKNRVYRLM